MQRVQNSAALVSFTHEPHRCFRIYIGGFRYRNNVSRTCGVCVLMRYIVRGSAASYLTDLCNICSDERLRLASRGLFAQRRTNTKLANKAFSVICSQVLQLGTHSLHVLGPLTLNVVSVNNFKHICFLYSILLLNSPLWLQFLHTDYCLSLCHFCI